MVGVYSRETSSSLERSDGCHSPSSSIEDEGEMISDEASGSWSGGSSEEGEIQSEIDEVDASPGASSLKEETPWERGLRLARERVQKAKIIRETDKDLMEKRMTLPVIEPVATVVVEPEETVVEDVFWPCYYQSSIVGHTELTSRRYLPEDLLPPAKEQTLAWRRSLRVSGRRRTSHYSPLSSRSASVSSQTSSRHSRHRSSSTGSFGSTSSIASIAESWKASCARALRDYLGSPTHGDGGGGKPRRGPRYLGGVRDGRGRSSSSGNSSSSRRTGSSKSVGRRRYVYTGGIARIKPSGRSGRTGISPSSRSSSGSPHRRDGQMWKGNRGMRREADRRRQGSDQGSGSPESTNRPLPLPHERPVKRPWVADPSLVSAGNMGGHVARAASRDGSSRSRSASPHVGDEKQYITSWSRSPSSGNERRPAWHRRERLPDVVPSGYSERLRRGVTPSRRRTSRSPFAGDQVNGSHLLPSSVTVPGPEVLAATGHGPPTRTGLSEHRGQGSGGVISGTSALGRAGTSSTAGHLAEGTGLAGKSGPPAEGALPLASSRPGVRMTLAPRLKSSGLATAAASLTGSATSRAAPANRQVFAMSPPPVARQLPPPSAASPPSQETPKPLSPTQIRMQAEAVAAIVEAREKRRAAAEAARRQRNPNRQRRKHPDLSNIPLRGRPTYRRVSFSSCSGSSTSRSSASSAGSSRSGSRVTAEAMQPQKSRKSGRHHLSTSKPGANFERTRQSGKYAAVGAGQQAQPLRRRQQQQQLPQHRAYQLDVEEFGDTGPGYDQPPMSGDMHHGYGRSGRLGAPFGGAAQRPPRRMLPATVNNSGGGGGRQFDRYGNPVYEAGPAYRAEGMRSYEMAYFDGDDMVGSHEPPSYHGDYRMRASRQPDNQSGGRYPVGRFEGRRTGPVFPASRDRPRTPHARTTADNYYQPFAGANRSPHGNYPSQPSVGAASRHQRNRLAGPDHDALGEMSQLTGRKRGHTAALAMDMVDADGGGGGYDEPVGISDSKRARSRHRSRGPGGHIDRSEPFESDVGNTYAAEQRLRQLRERLNFVDDAIAEIKAGGPVLSRK